MTKNKIEGNYRFFNESKTTYNECIPESELFKIKYMMFPKNNIEDLKDLSE